MPSTQDSEESVPGRNEGANHEEQSDPTLLIQEDVVWFHISGKRREITADGISVTPGMRLSDKNPAIVYLSKIRKQNYSNTRQALYDGLEVHLSWAAW